jgi:CheY-like chemotaxis protein
MTKRVIVKPGTMAEQGILGFVRDLFFSSKIAETAKGLGYPYVFARTETEFFSRLESGGPALLIVDLTAPGLDLVSFFDALGVKNSGIPVLAFTTHALWRTTSPVHARCQKVVTKEMLASELPEILQGFLGKAPAPKP